MKQYIRTALNIFNKTLKAPLQGQTFVAFDSIIMKNGLNESIKAPEIVISSLIYLERLLKKGNYGTNADELVKMSLILAIKMTSHRKVNFREYDSDLFELHENKRKVEIEKINPLKERIEGKKQYQQCLKYKTGFYAQESTKITDYINYLDEQIIEIYNKEEDRTENDQAQIALNKRIIAEKEKELKHLEYLVCKENYLEEYISPEIAELNEAEKELKPYKEKLGAMVKLEDKAINDKILFVENTDAIAVIKTYCESKEFEDALMHYINHGEKMSKTKKESPKLNSTTQVLADLRATGIQSKNTNSSDHFEEQFDSSELPKMIKENKLSRDIPSNTTEPVYSAPEPIAVAYKNF